METVCDTEASLPVPVICIVKAAVTVSYDRYICRKAAVWQTWCPPRRGASRRDRADEVGALGKIQIANIAGAVRKRTVNWPLRKVVADANIQGQARRYLVLVLDIASLNRPSIFGYEGISARKNQ